MIEIAKLRGMMRAEAKADDWWAGLSPKEKKVYLAAHPRSKYAKGAKGTMNDRRIGVQVNTHIRLMGSHDRKAAKAKSPALAKFHEKAKRLHASAAAHFLEAREALRDGKSERVANNHLSNAERTQHRIIQHMATMTKSPPKAASIPTKRPGKSIPEDTSTAKPPRMRRDIKKGGLFGPAPLVPVTKQPSEPRPPKRDLKRVGLFGGPRRPK